MAESNNVKKTLSGSIIHEGWKKNYRNKANEKFFELSFKYLTKVLGVPRVGSVLLDAGCGSCRHSILLDESGFNVVAIDYSEHVIAASNKIIREKNLDGKIKLQREDILNLSFENETFDYISCWGVLMHIPDVEKAILELARVLKKGGKLVISEVNMSSVEVTVTNFLRPFLKQDHIRSLKTKEGIEVWAKTEAGELLSRSMNIPWLISQLQEEGVVVLEHKSGQFTESYTRTSNRFINGFIHHFNNFWFKHIDFPSLACGNIIVFEKIIHNDKS